MYCNIWSISPLRSKQPRPHFSAKILQRGNLYQYTPTLQFVPWLSFIQVVNFPSPPRFGTNLLHKGMGVYSEFYGAKGCFLVPTISKEEWDPEKTLAVVFFRFGIPD